MNVTVRQTDFSDFEALQGIVQDGPTDVVPLGRGRMSGTLTHVALGPSFDISTGCFSGGVRLRGVPSQRRWLLGMVLATDGAASAQQHELVAGDLLVVGPGQERYSAYHDSTKYAAILVSREELDAFLATQPNAQDSAVWRRPATVLTADPVTAVASCRQMSVLLAALSEHGPRLSDGTTDFFERNVLELLTAPRDGVRYQGRLPRSCVALVREVDHFLVEGGNRPIHISELCERFNMHRRALHRAFINVLGMPPIAFLRRKRLGDVHTALLMAPPVATVKRIALEHGFAELGRFAGEYRRLFGELPSHTLRRVRSSLANWLFGCVWLADFASRTGV